MRLEQVVLFGPSDNFTIRFGPRLTVLAGLEQGERATLVDTLVAAMAGRLPNASVIFVDHAGRRVYADRMGATYADSGVAAPSLADLLGTDPGEIADLVLLRPEELGLGDRRDPTAVEAELAAARAAHEQAVAADEEATLVLARLEEQQRELEELDRQIEGLPEQEARWAWLLLRRELDRRRAELATSALAADDGDGDDLLLAAVDELRTAGEAWAEASTEAEELSLSLGPLPPVSDADLARIAATPEAAPIDLEARFEALERAGEARRAREADLAAADRDPEDPLDGIVVRLAAIDQDHLWEVHAAATTAQTTYEIELAHRPAEADDEAEVVIEEAHHEVVRCQRDVDRRFGPGILGSSALAVAALLAGRTISVPVGVVVLAGAVALACWLLVLPRRTLAEALAEEARALARTDADSWLGLHLRRIDAVMAKGDRTSLAASVDLRARTRLDWEELTGATTLDAAAERREAIEAYAAALDPTARAERTAAAVAALEQAAAHEQELRRGLAEDLGRFGLDASGTPTLGSSQLRTLVDQRAAAGRVARRALDLQRHQATATTAGATLDRLLRELGFGDGDLPGRLERAIDAIEAARRRRDPRDQPSQAELLDQIDELADRVEAGRRPGWERTEDPTDPPADEPTLRRRRTELDRQLASTPTPDRADLARRVGLAADRVARLDQELHAIAEGPTSVRRRFADRLARTSWLGPNEETLPLLVDDAFADVEPEELFKLLAMAARLSDRAQIVLFTSDPTVAKWARRETAEGVITLFEADGVRR